MQGKVRLNVQPLDVKPLIEAAIETMRPAAEAKEIRLQSVLDPRAGSSAGDSDRLQQIVWNLVSNAIKFTPKGGRVQVCLEQVNSHVEIAISDTGQGIEPEFVPSVFDRFRQVDSSTTRSYSGLGRSSVTWSNCTAARFTLTVRALVGAQPSPSSCR
ncbi:sensor histidine kinase [Microcoleus sp. FACHB-1515]|uniref:sensor histidine kinase n=2 Tax=Cyanophyceae TaxID=3028117 RepID=UPI0037CC45B5